MTTRVDVEEIETTKGEKLLAVALTAFLLIGLLWVYFNIDVERGYGLYGTSQSVVTEDDATALSRHEAATTALRAARRRVATARQQLVDSREAYRTSLDAGLGDPQLESAYRQAESAYAEAERLRQAAARARADAAPAAAAARARQSAAFEREQERAESQRRHDDRVTLARRLALVLIALGASYLLLSRLRTRRSRYLPAGMAAVAAVSLLALVMTVDYLDDYVEITDLGVLLLAVVGALMTLGAFVGLQRYLARRLPERRVRRRECPFCGYPVRDNPHCEGCGRDVLAECSTCHAPRRVGTRRCGACGAA